MANLTRLSQFIALVLRHKPDEFNITLDDNGYTDVDLVMQVIRQRYGDLYRLDDLKAVVAGDKDGKKRYEIVDGRIRALFGHNRSLNNISYNPVEPPEILYHGTAAEALSAIREAGLLPMSRQYVHLAIDKGRAGNVANRHSRNTVILTIRAKAAHDAGIQFYQPEAEQYLAQIIPPAFIDFPN